jgi:hypothetical protein
LQRGSAYPRHPASSPNAFTTTATATAPTLAAVPLYWMNSAAGGTSPVTATTASPSPRKASGAAAASCQRRSRRQSTIVASHRRTPARPSVTARTTLAAIRGPSRPGKWVGQASPRPTKPPPTTIGSHHAQLSAYASTKNMTSGAADARSRA